MKTEENLLLIGPGGWMKSYSQSGKQGTTGSAVGIYCRFGQSMLGITAPCYRSATGIGATWRTNEHLLSIQLLGLR